MRDKILLVEDEPAVQEFFTDCLSGQGYQLDVVGDGLLADQRLRAQTYSLVLTDVKLPGLDGLSLVAQHAGTRPETRFIVITGFGTVDDAVRAMKLGATDFLTKPIRPGELLDRVERALALRAAGSGAPAGPKDAPVLTGRGSRFQKLIEELELVAPMSTTVLLTGETGVGKDLTARYIHSHSARAKGPMVSLHCGAIPESLLEDELFGHAKGSFTGAIAARAGVFEMADGGTLFLDEIGTMSPPLQAKLLRILQDPEVRRLGETRSQRVNVRVIAATNCDLSKMVEEGSFRIDLYYRLAVYPIHVPALRERREDIQVLANYFCDRISARLGAAGKKLSEAALALMVGQDWPGNVRQLENVIERAVLLSRHRPLIEEADIVLDGTPPPVTTFTPGAASEITIPEQGLNFDSMVSQLERELILKSLEISGGNKKAAARLLQMKRTTLIEKLKRLSAPA